MKNYLLVFILSTIISCNKGYPGLQPLPTERQKVWQKMEYYAFIHFNMNTFTNMEWGYGNESPSTFNPTELDTDQWARIIKESGMKGIIITAKHHDGFSLWPSKFTEHSVKNSPWKNGKGDLIKDLENSCKKYGLKLGVYLSPWDRNHKDYGTKNYITYFRNQLTELLTNYGEIFEVWFDGANGGSGYYGGANDIRRVDKITYYDWKNTHKLIRELQPKAVIFSDAGPDIRWVGNEKGYASKTTWSNIYRDSLYAGMPNYNKFSSGQELGTHFIPTETDVSIRPGWYYHPEEDDKVKSLDKLIDARDKNADARLQAGAASEILRVKLAYMNGLRRGSQSIPVGQLFPEYEISDELKLNTDQLIGLLDNLEVRDDHRVRAAYLLADKRNGEAAMALVNVVANDANLDVVREAAMTFSELTGFRNEDLLDSNSLIKWWQKNSDRVLPNLSN